MVCSESDLMKLRRGEVNESYAWYVAHILLGMIELQNPSTICRDIPDGNYCTDYFLLLSLIVINRTDIA